ncbi:MAG TPA: hypothetical protein VFV38_27215 [Ktedonobacteraceae bacterium]|nr:hypothetical protein [Ktedonobacteraceae bacterium]
MRSQTSRYHQRNTVSHHLFWLSLAAMPLLCLAGLLLLASIR